MYPRLLSFVHDPMHLVRPATVATLQAALPAHLVGFKGLDTAGVRRIIVSKVLFLLLGGLSLRDRAVLDARSEICGAVGSGPHCQGSQAFVLIRDRKSVV